MKKTYSIRKLVIKFMRQEEFTYVNFNSFIIKINFLKNSLIDFMPMFHFYSIVSLLTFSWGVETEHKCETRLSLCLVVLVATDKPKIKFTKLLLFYCNKYSQLCSGLGIKHYIYPNAIRHRTKWMHG